MEQLVNNAQSTLSASIASGDTTLTVTSATNFPTSGNFRIIIDNELILVTSVSSNTFTITRGQEGTTAASHSSGAAVTHIITAKSLKKVIGLNLLEEHTASNSATLDFTNWYSSDYDEYIIEFISILPVTDAVQFELQASTNGGSTYDTISGHYNNKLLFWSHTGTANEGGTTGTFTWLSGSSRKLSNVAANGGFNGTFRLINPGSTIINKLIYGQSNFYNTNDSDYSGCSHISVYTQTAAINALRLLMSSGNISSGTVRIYGIAKG